MTRRDDYDTPWKEILAFRFPDFMAFFFPEIAREIDWSRGYETLDKELRQIARESETGKRLADNLIKVWKTDGEEAWVLVHVEVQGQPETDFGERVFVYQTRIRDLYRRPVVSLAVLADDRPDWYVGDYREALWGCRIHFEFPAVKLLAYRTDWPALESAENPFAVVVMAHLRTMETRNDHGERLDAKLRLSKSLYRRGWTKAEIINLYRFIDWVMRLPEDLEKAYHDQLSKYERKINMPYVTTAERIGLEKGMKKGIQKGIEKGVRKGKKEGKREQALLTAGHLLALGVLTEDQIAMATELGVEEIRRLKRELAASALSTDGKSS